MFERLIKLIDEEDLKKIREANILLVGVGGVGGFVLECLGRSGFSNLTIVDGDKIDISNLNRQIITKLDNVGKRKVEEALNRLLEINCNIDAKIIDIYLTKENFREYINQRYDYIIDACDDIKVKVELIRYAQENNIKIITCLGTGRKLKPELLEITKLNKTFNDPLAKKLRYELRKENLSLNTLVLFSKEEAIKTEGEIGSAIFVPAVAGIMLANYVFLDLIKKDDA